MKNLLFLALFAFLLGSCNNSQTPSETTNEEPEEVIVMPAEKTISGTYTLADMIPITGDKELTEQDNAYIAQAKERTVGKTTLTLNNDGSFTRVFPNPSGDETTTTWEGTYVHEGDKLTMNVSREGETRGLDFKVLAQEPNKLSISSAFGQIEMNYVYTK